jgi:hypothetical protein
MCKRDRSRKGKCKLVRMGKRKCKQSHKYNPSRVRKRSPKPNPSRSQSNDTSLQGSQSGRDPLPRNFRRPTSLVTTPCQPEP